MQTNMQTMINAKCKNVKSLVSVFERIDQDNSGSLSQHEFVVLCKLFLRKQKHMAVPDNLAEILHGVWKNVLGDEQESEINFQSST